MPKKNTTIAKMSCSLSIFEVKFSCELVFLSLALLLYYCYYYSSSSPMGHKASMCDLHCFRSLAACCASPKDRWRFWASQVFFYLVVSILRSPLGSSPIVTETTMSCCYSYGRFN